MIGWLSLILLAVACGQPPPEAAPASPDARKGIGLKPLHVEVEVPEALRVELGPADPTAPADDVYLVSIDGITVPATASAFVRVFANLPEADSDTPVEHPGFLGYISVLPMSTSSGLERDPQNVTFELDRTHLERWVEEQSLSLTLVPLARHEADGSRVSLELSFDRVYVDRRRR